MRPWHPIVLACLVACGSGQETTRIDLLSVLDEGTVETATTIVDVGEPSADRLLGDGWAVPARLADGATGRDMTARVATLTLFAGTAPVDAELRERERADDGERKNQNAGKDRTLNGYRCEPLHKSLIPDH